MYQVPKDNAGRLELLSSLLAGTANPDPTGSYRDSWDEVTKFDSDVEAEIDYFLDLIAGVVSNPIGAWRLREISSLLRETSARVRLGKTTQVAAWLNTATELISKCDTNHMWRYKNGAEWYHDAINSVCGNATHSAVSIILLNPDITSDPIKLHFKNFLNLIINNHIEDSASSHSEPVISTLGRNAVWLSRTFPGWLETNVLAQLGNFESQVSRAFWQGFLVNRKWDLEFLTVSSLDCLILNLLKQLKSGALTYDSYFGRDSSESFVFLMVELFLRTPEDEQLEFLFRGFASLESNSLLFIRWIDAMSWSMHKIDWVQNPTLSDEIYLRRIKPFLDSISDLHLNSQSVGILAELLGALRNSFPEALEYWKVLVSTSHSLFSRNSRILMWLTYDANTEFLVENHPSELLTFIRIYLAGMTRDKAVGDWELAEFISKYGRRLFLLIELEFKTFLEFCERSGFARASEAWKNLTEPN